MKIEGQGSAASLIAQTANDAVKSGQDKPVTANVGVANTGSQEQEKAKPVVKHVKEVEDAAAVLNEAMKIYNYHLEFKVHQASGKMQVKVVDSDSKKVIREIPPESILDFSARIRELLDHMAGILVDERV